MISTRFFTLSKNLMKIKDFFSPAIAQVAHVIIIIRTIVMRLAHNHLLLHLRIKIRI